MTEIQNTRLIADYDPHYEEFRKLMPYRVREVLFVSSLYDSYILEEDGQIGEGVDVEYYELNLSYSPRFTRVSTGKDALDAIEKGNFDMVISKVRVGEMDVIEFGRAVKVMFPDMPVVLLADTPAEAVRVKEKQAKDTRSPAGIDQAFVWRGDLSIFLAIFKYIEDLRNTDHDTRLARVRVLILIENSVRFYSSYLPLLYTQLMKQTQALMADGVNTMQRLRRMKARTKVLLAETFEQGWALFEKYRRYVLGIISDARFPRGGRSDPLAGLEFTSQVKEEDPDMPILIQSSDIGLIPRATALGAAFMNKRSPQLLEELVLFLQKDLGFGDFVFRLPDSTTVGRVPDLAAMPAMLAKIPAESIRYHALRNHFSNWCMARSEFALASLLRPRKVSEFKDIEEMRQHLIAGFSQLRDDAQKGLVVDFSRTEFDESSTFARIGSGSLGGKGRGLGFIHSHLSQSDMQKHFERERIFVPPSAVIGTDVFDDFIRENQLAGVALSDASDREIAKAFLDGVIPRAIGEDLRVFIDRTRYPIAVRSSSLLEDSYQHAFAGIYKTFMLANNHPDDRMRLDELCRAIKLVYASTFFRNAKAYLHNTPNRMEEEKMAVVLQKLVGQHHDGYFYPDFAGVARSYNFYPLKGPKPEEGVVSVALGLGKTVVEGNRAVRFSPAQPTKLLQFSSNEDFLKNAQRQFYALHTDRLEPAPLLDSEGWVSQLDLDAAEQHGTLNWLGSVYSIDNDAVYSGISRQGVRLVTFAPILTGNLYPLPNILNQLLELGSHSLGCPVEIEFAVNLKPESGGPPEFAFLQIRPMAIDTEAEDLDLFLKDVDPGEIFVSSHQAIGQGRIETVRDVIYVKPTSFDRSRTTDIAGEVELLNHKLSQKERPYLLIGPGRWGTADRWLGIPVEWYQISGIRAVIETDMEEMSVEPSEGTHFFQNLTTLSILYFNVHNFENGGSIDFSWLDNLPVTEETHFLRHVQLEIPLDIRVDGKAGRGIVLKQIHEQ